MKVVILGGNGFIGRNLASYMNTIGYQVCSFDINYPIKKECGIEYIVGDFFNDLELENCVSDADIVVHAVSTINPGNSNEVYLSAYQKDFLQSVKLASYTIKYSCQLLYLSSGGTVYGRQDIQPITEKSVTEPINHYGNVKLCIENTYRTMIKQQNAKICIARIANPYGPGQDYTKGVGFIDAVLKKAINNETLDIYGDGSVERDYIYIDDVCRMLVELLKTEKKMDIYNIGTSVGTSQKEIVKMIREIVPTLKVCYLKGRQIDVPKIILDNTEIKKLYNKPITKIKEGIIKYYDYLLENKMT